MCGGGREFWAERARSSGKGSRGEKAARDEKDSVDGGSLWEAGKHQVAG